MKLNKSLDRQQILDFKVELDIYDIDERSLDYFVEYANSLSNKYAKDVFERDLRSKINIIPQYDDGSIEIWLEFWREETDEEYKQRINAIKQKKDEKLKKQIARAAEKERQRHMSEEDRERELYLTLKEKYERDCI